MPRRRAHLCALLLLAAPVLAPVPPVATVALLAGATEAAAQQRARSSGGYARPSAPRSRTPSVGRGGGWGAAPRTPSVGGGYSRPGASYGRGPSSYGYGSSGDRALSRQGSGSALERYRAQSDAARRQREAPPAVRLPPPSAGTTGRERWGLPPARPRYDYRPDYGRGYGTDWYRDRGWSAPGGGVFGGLGGRSFGVWDGLFLGYLLNNLTRPGSVDFFRNHQDDPGVRQWREEAERQAQDNAELRERLDRLDRELAQQRDGQGQQPAPRDPNYLPPDVPPEVALAPGPSNDARTPTTAPADGGDGAGFGLWLPVLVVGGAGLAFLSFRRGRQQGGGTGTGGTGVKGPLGSAGAMLRHKLSGERYSPSLYRVGMTVTADPTPFILAGDAIKVPPPVPPGSAAGSGRVSIAEVGRVEGGAVDFVRLHLPERRGFFQIHAGADGRPDECRFFAPIDEVSPASAEEWGAWLDPNEGMIGWPEFQTKDGKLYGRAWVPGEARVAPLPLVETIEAAAGGAPRTVRSQAMLYAAPTGAPEPAPPVEYILVSAVEAEGQAWVEIAAGIDVNPATLSLA
ncbi:hypothetical protein GCM10009416_40210 [Craurococcus roseus]|uniref:DUF2491 family protein n=1 Tax=Craurococcus roseus TaxID=77585 RepID=A0ABN1FU96_9PROT